MSLSSMFQCLTTLIENNFLPRSNLILGSSSTKPLTVDVAYLEFFFYKAFGTVFHSVLLKKLSACGLDGWMLHQLKNWLDGGVQRVMVNGVITGW